MIDPSGIPQFTGDFDQLDKDTSGLRGDAIGIRNGGMDVHSRFQMLEAFYTAPEADDLFATTQPVMDKADAFAAQLETVADALDTYSIEARPLAKKLAQLKTDAFAFVDSVEGDDNWTYDGDKIHRHQELMDGVAAAESAFREAERRGRHQDLIPRRRAGVRGRRRPPHRQREDGDVRLRPRRPQARRRTRLGAPRQSESHHAWRSATGPRASSGDGLVIDNIWGGIKGLGTLVGWNGSDAAGDAWGHLGDVVSGIGQYTAKPYDALMDWAIGPDKESATEVRQKKAAKDFAKSMVAWDMWSENPARAAATVVFNGLTLGAGPRPSRAKGGEVGAVARCGIAAKVGEYIDPVAVGLKPTGKAISALPELSDLTAGIRTGIGASADSQRIHSVIELGDGSKVVIEDGKFIPVDKHGNVIGDTPRQEVAADTRATPEETPAQQRQPAGVGAASGTPGATAQIGEASGGAGASHTVGSETPRSGGGPIGSGHGGTGSEQTAAAGPPSAAGDDALGDGADRPDSDIPGQRTEVERPSFMREGNPYGHRGSLTLEQIEEILGLPGQPRARLLRALLPQRRHPKAPGALRRERAHPAAAHSAVRRRTVDPVPGRTGAAQAAFP